MTRTNLTYHVVENRKHVKRHIEVAKVTHFVASDRYSEAHHADGRVLLRESLNALEAEFPHDFVRIHRSSLVRRSLIRSLATDEYCEVWQVELEGIPGHFRVSRGHLPSVREQLAQ